MKVDKITKEMQDKYSEISSLLNLADIGGYDLSIDQNFKITCTPQTNSGEYPDIRIETINDQSLMRFEATLKFPDMSSVNYDSDDLEYIVDGWTDAAVFAGSLRDFYIDISESVYSLEGNTFSSLDELADEWAKRVDVLEDIHFEDDTHISISSDDSEYILTVSDTDEEIFIERIEKM